VQIVQDQSHFIMSQHSPRPDRHGVVAVVVRDGRLLVIRRSKAVVAPGAFCFPGGAIEQDESVPEALIREIREELGVEIRPCRQLWESVTPWNVHLCWWLAELAPEALPRANPAEVQSIHWYTPEEMRRLPDLLESNLHFLDALSRGQFVLECNPTSPNTAD
jgi:8-oxo-dGTP diphosphatase